MVFSAAPPGPWQPRTPNPFQLPHREPHPAKGLASSQPQAQPRPPGRWFLRSLASGRGAGTSRAYFFRSSPAVSQGPAPRPPLPRFYTFLLLQSDFYEVFLNEQSLAASFS